MRFGPAGIPIACEGGTADGVKTVAQLGLGAMEVEFVRGVKMSETTARDIGKIASSLNISLSCHAPYWINCCAREKIKLDGSIRNILDSAKAAHALGARVIVFHPGFYMGRGSAECKALVKSTMLAALEKMHALNIRDVILGMELTGKGSQFGDITEICELAAEIPQSMPVIDFAHHHARNNGCIKTADDYLKLFTIMEKHLGRKAVENFHSHFSEIEYTMKGERRHLELGTTNQPPFSLLAKVCVENGFQGTIICETPLLEQDSMKMQKAYLAESKK
ncbi:MAG: TIM barrel protein [Candidatus Micrarchaeia archaeon]|jgi:deoxyribonuclease-4